ncbi:MAG: hypothetical protein K0S23_264 [Fluviicola sp.]|jgi:hypothetical protein|uniref:DUF4919 domain-containing protein n=1 Tax=Fluviicola sp. TaxID=1917219 RepID=UPI00262DA199|nr:DUF4919 domain-containing protein [Fluviicola sp.]MDF3025957.1 hypothetical protein [Fluviicola sp.]
MKYHLVILFLTAFLVACSAQDKKVLIEGKEVPIFDADSEFFHEKVRSRLAAFDTTLTPKHMLSYTHYVQLSAPFNPSDLDLKAKKVYKLNEEKQYRDALEKCRELLMISPNNITGFKEMGFAFKKLGEEDSVQICFTLMVKAIEGAKLSGNGDIKSPYVLNNSFELTSLIEATTGLYVDKSPVIKDSKGRILVLGFVQSPRMGRFALINHWFTYLKEGEFVTEENLDKQQEEEEKMMKEEIERFEKEFND